MSALQCNQNISENFYCTLLDDAVAINGETTIEMIVVIVSMKNGYKLV